jgi:hypothetical protein
MLVTLAGRVTLVSAVQLENAPLLLLVLTVPMLANPCGRETLVSELPEG